MRFLYGADWGDPLLYDVVINTDRLTIESGARLLAQALADERFRPTPESRRRVADLNLAAQAKVALLVIQALVERIPGVTAVRNEVVGRGSIRLTARRRGSRRRPGGPAGARSEGGPTSPA